MAAIPANAKDFLLNSDYPLDKVVHMLSGSFAVASGGSYAGTVPHGLSFTPLAYANWSTSSTWDVVYEEETGPIAAPNSYSPFTYRFTCETNATDLTLNFSNFLSGAALTVYYRVYFFMPSNVNVAVEHTASGSTDLQFSSDYNYTKLLASGVYSMPDTTGTSSTESYVHGLGYRPQAIYWVERSGAIQHITQARPAGGAIGCRVDTTTMYITSDDAIPATVHWRLYADQ